MYTMTIDGRPFYDPMLTSYGLEAPTIHLEANRIGTLVFTIYETHPEYNAIVLRQSIIRLYRDGQIKHVFRPVKRRRMFRGAVEYTCEELTAMLNDLLRRPKAFEGTAEELMRGCIADFTAHSSELVVIPPAQYIRSLWPFKYVNSRASILANPYYGTYKISYYDGRPDDENTGYLGPDNWTTEFSNILAVLGYFGNVYIPPATDWKSLYPAICKFAQDHNLQYNGTNNQGFTRIYDSSYNLVGWYVGEAWILSLMDTAGIIDALITAYQDLLAQLPSDPDDDAEWDEQQSGSVDFLFLVGQTPASGESFVLEEGDYMSYWDFIQKSLIEQFGGYIVPEWSENICRLHYRNVEDLPLCNQAIEFGVNMADVFVDTDSESAFSILVPRGKDGITIKIDPTDRDYLTSEDAIRLYGKKESQKEWPEIETAQELKSTASQWLVNNAIQIRDEIEVTGYDMKYAGVDTDYLEFMSRIPCRCPKPYIDEALPLTACDLPLDTPVGDMYRLNSKPDSMADIINKK